MITTMIKSHNSVLIYSPSVLVLFDATVPV